MKELFSNLLSYMIAILRLLLLQVTVFFNGLHHILFNRVEICRVTLSMIPLKVDRDKLSYLDKLALNTNIIAGGSVAEETCGSPPKTANMGYMSDEEINNLYDEPCDEDFQEEQSEEQKDEGDENPPNDDDGGTDVK
jgi:hypothetical protein